MMPMPLGTAKTPIAHLLAAMASYVRAPDKQQLSYHRQATANRALFQASPGGPCRLIWP